MPEQSYHQFCPVAMAAEVLCPRWTMLILRELLMGCTRFNELRRGLPRISPALLSQRLKELEELGVIERHASTRELGIHEYYLTQMGQELEPLVVGFGKWGHRWISSDLSLQRLDAQLLMWDIGRNLNVEPAPPVRKVVKFSFEDTADKDRDYWLVVAPACEADVCKVDPGHDVDLYVTCELKAMTAVWMGMLPWSAAVGSDRIRTVGDPRLAHALPKWLKLSSFAPLERMVS
jgi:DNA-binding HxlR family transcriptional regulator